MDGLGPTREQQRHATYEAPERSQRKNSTAYRQKSELELMRSLEPEHIRAGLKLHQQYWGSMGADVRNDEITHTGDVPDEFRQHACSQAVSCMKNAIGSDRVWEATLAVCAEDVSPTYVGHVMGGYKSRAQAKAYGDAIVSSGLDILATYLGYKPPG